MRLKGKKSALLTGFRKLLVIVPSMVVEETIKNAFAGSKKHFKYTAPVRAIPVKKDSEGGPGMLSSADLKNLSLNMDHSVYNGRAMESRAFT